MIFFLSSLVFSKILQETVMDLGFFGGDWDFKFAFFFVPTGYFSCEVNIFRNNRHLWLKIHLLPNLAKKSINWWIWRAYQVKNTSKSFPWEKKNILFVFSLRGISTKSDDTGKVSFAVYTNSHSTSSSSP